MNCPSVVIALCAWVTGLLIFLISGLIFGGALIVIVGAIGIFISFPAFILYWPATWAIRKLIRRHWQRILVLSVLSLVLTDKLFRGCAYSDDISSVRPPASGFLVAVYDVFNVWHIDHELLPFYWCALASTFLSILSVWNKLKDRPPAPDSQQDYLTPIDHS